VTPGSLTGPFAFFLWLVTVSSLSAQAQGVGLTPGAGEYDGDLPVEIPSTELDLNQRDGSAVFSGDVIIRQGPLIMTCRTVSVEYDAHPTTGENRITEIRLSDDVTFASGGEAAESERATYSPTDGLLVMTGDVLIAQGITTVNADRLEYDLASGNARVEGNVKTVLRLDGN